MKAARFLIIVLVIGFAAVVAKADGVDPRITIGGGGSCEAFSLTSLTQSFTDLPVGCQIDFTNNIPNDNDDNQFNEDGEFDGGVTLFQLVVNVTSGFTGTLSCDQFEGSIFTVESFTATSCTFVSKNGFAPGNTISLQFDNDPNGAGGFNNNSVDVVLAQDVVNTPEPASALLLLTGAGALFAFRKRRQATS